MSKVYKAVNLNIDLYDRLVRAKCWCNKPSVTNTAAWLLNRSLIQFENDLKMNEKRYLENDYELFNLFND